MDSLEATMSVHPELGKAQADLARCWIHYSLHLFGTSKKVILERMCKEAEAQTTGKLCAILITARTTCIFSSRTRNGST